MPAPSGLFCVSFLCCFVCLFSLPPCSSSFVCLPSLVMATFDKYSYFMTILRGFFSFFLFSLPCACFFIFYRILDSRKSPNITTLFQLERGLLPGGKLLRQKRSSCLPGARDIQNANVNVTKLPAAIEAETCQKCIARLTPNVLICLISILLMLSEIRASRSLSY